MATATSTRNLQYRKAILHSAGTKTLQTLLSVALKKLKHPVERQEPLDSQGENLQLINYAYTQRSMMCGNMFIYSKGAAQLLMRATEVEDSAAEANSFPLEAVSAPGKGAEFLESILYFCVCGDHVLLMQSRALRANGFEQYVDWLLNKAELFTERQAVMLVDQPKESAAAAIKRHGVKSVTYGTSLVQEIDARAGARRGQAEVTITESPIIAAIRNLLGQRIDHLRLEDALDGRIEARLTLAWKQSTTPKAQNVLDTIASALRHIDKEHVEIELNKAGKISGGELQLQVPVTVTTRNKVVEQAALFKIMRDKMSELLTGGQIGA